MFDADNVIAEWRRQLIADGIKSPEVLEELESHLREEVERQMQIQPDSRQAFQAAVLQLGESDLLKTEFAKNCGFNERWHQIKQAVLTLAGIPNSNFATTMNTSQANPEPGWATYLKGAAFAMPALFLWTISAVFIVPKFQQIARDTGFPESSSTGLWNVTHTTISLTNFFGDHGHLIATAVIAMLVVFEWRAGAWPRYRRLTVGTSAFVLNLVVLLSIFAMLLAMMIMAPALAHHGAVP
jgi:hypothetical protein